MHDSRFGVLILNDSSINVRGLKEFEKRFNFKIDPIFKYEVHISKMSDDNLILQSNENENTIQIVEKTLFEVNPVDYFNKLKDDIERFKIITIKESAFNTIDLVFSRHIYLKYVPDSLELLKEERVQLDKILEQGTKLDANWYLYRDEIDIDYTFNTSPCSLKSIITA